MTCNANIYRVFCSYRLKTMKRISEGQLMEFVLKSMYEILFCKILTLE